jgi:hypothetical protein
MPVVLCHGILRASDAHVAAMIGPAHPQGRLLVVIAGDLAALATEIPDSVSINGVMADPEGLALLATGHNRVLTTCAQTTDIVPSRLDSLHSNEAALAAMVGRETDRVAAALDRIAGCNEYAVRIEFPPRGAAVQPMQHASGRDYLAARLAVRDRASTLRQSASELAERVVSGLTAASRTFAIQPIPADARTRTMLSAVCLVERTAARAFGETIDELASQVGASGHRLVATGPWPAYHFSA